jgi:hypothetical protein
MLDGISEKVLVSIFLLLLVAGVYFLGKLYSCANYKLMDKYRFLGPFAFLIPRALGRDGWVYLCAFLGVMATLFALGVHMFSFDELLYSGFQ